MLLDFIDLKKGNGAVYMELYNQINSAIENGIIKKGEKLPSIREAASQLRVSRTTVENAYLRLCIEGTVESLPQRGYYIRQGEKRFTAKPERTQSEERSRYDFSGRSIDISAADTEFWKKTVREILRDTEELTSYGDPRGEAGLRNALSLYAYKARGVRASAENIIVGAGIGPLLNILCALIGKECVIGMENGEFEQASRIFSDYGINTRVIRGDLNGAVVSEIEKNNIGILFLQPSALSKISVTGLSSRRNEFIDWANKSPDRLFIEDDYNGELRYTARSVTAFQGKCPERTVYIGSFSKLLLPSVRIAYMVLPDSLSVKLNERLSIYNQTCGKVEQLALRRYIETGALEKHLKRLRKLYNEKSRICGRIISELIPSAKQTLFESSLTVLLEPENRGITEKIYSNARKYEISLGKTASRNEVRLCFAGISKNDIYTAIRLLSEDLPK